MKTRLILLTFLTSIWSFPSFSQRNVKDSIIGTPIFALHYGGNLTSADLKDRYGYLNHIGGLVGYKTSENWFWGVEANFIFGNKIRMNDPLKNLRDSNGNITDENGEVIANTSPSHMFNKNGEVLKMSKILKVEAEKTMNELSYAMVDYLLK